jgi:hypothetical protein
MSGVEIALVLVMLAIVGGAIYYAVRGGRGPAPPKTTEQSVKQGREDILAGRVAPPIAGDPRRTPGGACRSGWHGVLQWDLSSQCDADQWVRDLLPSGPAGSDFQRPEMFGPNGELVLAAPDLSRPSTFLVR